MDRRYALGGLTLALGLLAAATLWRVLTTVFLAATVAYVLSPVDEWYVRRGLPNWWAAFATTLTGVGIAVAIVSPVLAVLYFRFDALRTLLTDLPVPAELSLSLFGFTQTVRLADLVPAIVAYLRSLVVEIARAAPIVAIKLTLFAIVLFALLLARDRLHAAVRAVVPSEYHGVVDRLASRAKDTLVAIYVLQAATAIATFVMAVPVFLLLGYEYPFTLATAAGFLQFLPIVGPSVLVLGIAIVDVVLSNVTRAVLVTVVGLVLIAWLPDPLVRPRLARRTADLPGSLYFIGFTGGLFTVGVVGVVAGPLVVALLSESVRTLAREMDGSSVPSGEPDHPRVATPPLSVAGDGGRTPPSDPNHPNPTPDSDDPGTPPGPDESGTPDPDDPDPPSDPDESSTPQPDDPAGRSHTDGSEE